jgi:malic enzyme
MEGKAVLFKRFADVDAIDIELEDRGRRPVHRTRSR